MILRQIANLLDDIMFRYDYCKLFFCAMVGGLKSVKPNFLPVSLAETL